MGTVSFLVVFRVQKVKIDEWLLLLDSDLQHQVGPESHVMNDRIKENLNT